MTDEPGLSTLIDDVRSGQQAAFACWMIAMQLEAGTDLLAELVAARQSFG